MGTVFPNLSGLFQQEMRPATLQKLFMNDLKNMTHMVLTWPRNSPHLNPRITQHTFRGLVDVSTGQICFLWHKEDLHSSSFNDMADQFMFTCETVAL